MTARFSFYSNHNGVVHSFEKEFDNVLGILDIIHNIHKTCLGQRANCNVNVDKLKEDNDLIDFSAYQAKQEQYENLERMKAEERDKELKEYEEKRRGLITLLRKTEDTLRYVNSFAEKFPDDVEVITDQEKLKANIEKLKEQIANLKQPQ